MDDATAPTARNGTPAVQEQAPQEPPAPESSTTGDAQPQPTTPPPSTGGKASASLLLGIVAMVAWLLPLIGVPVAIVGLTLGFIDRHSPKRGHAIVGIALSGLGLILSVLNIIWAIHLVTTGQEGDGPLNG